VCVWAYLCWCVCVCIYAGLRVCVCVCLRNATQRFAASVYLCLCLNKRVCVCVQCWRVYAWCAGVCVRERVCVHTSIHTKHTHAHTYTHTHTCTHTYTRTHTTYNYICAHNATLCSVHWLRRMLPPFLPTSR